MKRVLVTILCLSLVGVLIVLFTGCAIGKAKDLSLEKQAKLTQAILNTKSSEDGIALVEKLTNQILLVKVALESTTIETGVAAVRKLTDQTLLEEVAEDKLAVYVLKTKDNKPRDYPSFKNIVYKQLDLVRVRQTAVEMLADQTLLVKIAREDSFGEIRMAAIRKLTDQSLLAEIAQNDPEERVRQTAELVIKLIKKMDNGNINSLHVFIRGFADVPIGVSSEIMESILPAFQVLSDPEISQVLGDITTFIVDWDSESQLYQVINNFNGKKTSIYGESITCRIKLSKIPYTIYHKWETWFPDEIVTAVDFLDANIDISDLFFREWGKVSVLQSVPQSVLARIAQNYDYASARRVAVLNLTDQTLLGKIAREDSDGDVRSAAQTRLTELQDNK